MRTQIKNRTQRTLTKAALSVLMATLLVGLSGPVQAAEDGYLPPDVNVYVGCRDDHLMSFNASIEGAIAGNQLQASYNIGGGTEHSMGVVWTGQVGIGTTNTMILNSPYPQTWINVTIGGYHGSAMSKACA